MLGRCKAPTNWDPKLRFTPNQRSYALNQLVHLSCAGRSVPSVPQIRCISSGTQTLWNETATCKEICQRPAWWDPRLQMAPARESYTKNEVVTLTCNNGSQPSFTHVKCAERVQPWNYSGSLNADMWLGRKSSDVWIHVEGNIECIGVLQVVPETVKITSTSIKLNWTCMLPDTCQNIRARCRLEGHSSPPCEAEEVKGEEMLQGEEGTFTCPPLQPFTVYSVTISLLPSTILYTRFLRTKESVPDKPEKLWFDTSRGSLSWKELPSCKGEITGYQLNITTMRADDSSFLEFKQVLVNQSVTEYTPPHQTAGSKYVVTVQGLTAAGAGTASMLEFRTYAWVSGQPLGPWPGSVVTVVVVVLVLVPLSGGILWFVLSRKKKVLPSKVEEDDYTELQPYENVHEDNYCVIKTFLAEKDAGKCGHAGEPVPKPLPVMESSGDSRSSEGEKKLGQAPVMVALPFLQLAPPPLQAEP
ncbi:uncharacterized protein LOC113960704 [Neopelma chrysocephalum]|uniref:uncharacterized protein LOC113960704 n=1 Tax=Neopelma chrysocephalum TaxID=114329 RepID=UPI000FCD2879|nr:uncharacterized protein LOC113960704 [Neopelma chrysocephalum]